MEPNERFNIVLIGNKNITTSNKTDYFMLHV